MRQPLSGKAVANEIKYPYIVELVVADDKLDVEVSRRIMRDEVRPIAVNIARLPDLLGAKPRDHQTHHQSRQHRSMAGGCTTPR
jgi:hypothetical protein